LRKPQLRLSLRRSGSRAGMLAGFVKATVRIQDIGRRWRNSSALLARITRLPKIRIARKTGADSRFTHRPGIRLVLTTISCAARHQGRGGETSWPAATLADVAFRWDGS
jgi:hypothetical protein